MTSSLLIIPPYAALAAFLLGLFAAAVTRAWLRFLGELSGYDATVHALRAGVAVLLAGLGLTALMQLLGSATAVVLPVLLVLGCARFLRRSLPGARP